MEQWEFSKQFDEITGFELDPAKVKLGREKELSKLKARGVYDVVSRDKVKEGKLVKTR